MAHAITTSNRRRLNAAESGSHVMYCSLEMTAVALAQRALTALAFKLSGGRRGIPYSGLRSGRGITDDDYALLRDAQDNLHALPFTIEQQPSLTLAQIAMRARRRKQKFGLDLVIIDHLHKIRPADRYRGQPTAEIAEMSTGCAALAKELDIGVLALCQLSRATEGRSENDRSSQIYDSREALKRTPTWCCLYFVKPITSRTWLIASKSALPSSVKVRQTL
jgi:replicative DNA helicase